MASSVELTPEQHQQIAEHLAATGFATVEEWALANGCEFVDDDRWLDPKAYVIDPAEYLIEQLDKAEQRANEFTLRQALAQVDEHGFGHNVDADDLIRRAAQGLLSLYDAHELDDISDSSAADQCESLYEVLCSVGLDVP